MDFLQKLDFLMAREGFNKKSFSDASGVPYMTIVDFYRKGYANVKLSTVKKISTYFGVTLDYLLRDEITNPDYGLDSVKQEQRSAAQLLRNESLLKEYNRLDDFGRMAVHAVLDAELKRIEAVRKIDSPAQEEEPAWERDARLLEEEAEAVRKGGGELLASQHIKDA